MFVYDAAVPRAAIWYGPKMESEGGWKFCVIVYQFDDICNTISYAGLPKSSLEFNFDSYDLVLIWYDKFRWSLVQGRAPNPRKKGGDNLRELPSDFCWPRQIALRSGKESARWWSPSARRIDETSLFLLISCLFYFNGDYHFSKIYTYTCETLSRRRGAFFRYGAEINGRDLGAFGRGEVLERLWNLCNFLQTLRIAWNSAPRWKYRDNLKECRAALGSAENCQPAKLSIGRPLVTPELPEFIYFN